MSDDERISSAAREDIPIMHCFDNNYVIPAIVSFYSMLQNASKEYNYVLYVLHTDITIQNQHILQEVVGRFPNARLEFIDMDHWLNDVFSELKFPGHLSKEVLYKLAVGRIFPQYDKLIITDVDVIFSGDISTSWEMLDASSGVCFAGVHQVCPETGWLRDYYENYTVNYGEGYIERLRICGGYLIANLRYMRDADKETQFLEFLNENTDKMLQLEQDVINFCCDDSEISYLPLNFVTCSYMYDVFADEQSRSTDLFYSKEKIQDAMDHPVQLHYATSVKPWTDAVCTKSELWYNCLSETGYLDLFFHKKRGLVGRAPETIDNAVLRNFAKQPAPKTKVSVLCGTYNHEKFIRETLEGLVNQNTSFPYEIIVSDDASTDGTQAIIREFYDKYPDKIRPILRKENVGIGINYYEALTAVEGEYLAVCDGDDVWIDPDKLAKQVAFLDSHLDYNVLCSSFMRREYQDDGTFNDAPFIVNDYIKTITDLKDSYTFEDLLNCRFIGSCTMMLRWQLRGGYVPEFLKYHKTIDFPLAILHAAGGKIGVMNNEMFSRYAVHKASISFQAQYKAENDAFTVLNEIDQLLQYRFHQLINSYIRQHKNSGKPKSLTSKISGRLNKKTLVPVQLFYAKSNGDFNESASVILEAEASLLSLRLHIDFSREMYSSRFFKIKILSNKKNHILFGSKWSYGIRQDMRPFRVGGKIIAGLTGFRHPNPETGFVYTGTDMPNQADFVIRWIR